MTLIVLPLWGERHVSHFLVRSWPSLRRNMADLPGSRLKIYTGISDIGALRAALPKSVSVEEVDEAEIKTTFSGTMMTRLHQRGFDDARRNDEPFMPICGDAVFGDGSFAAISRAAISGKRAVMIFIPGMREEFFAGLDPERPAMCRELASVYLAAVDRHQATPIQWTDRPFAAHPAYIVWRAGLHGHLGRRFHVAPIYLHARKDHRMHWSVDNDLVENSGVTLDECYFAEDSDELFICDSEISDRAPHAEMPEPPEATVEHVARWAKLWSRDFGRECFRRRFWVHDGELSEDNRRDALDRSDRIVEQILATGN